MTTTLTSRPGFAAGSWKLDLIHSELSFTVRHLGVSKVRGTFESFDLTVVTAEDGSVSVEATVDVASVSTKQEQRDNHLRSGDFFLAEEFPQASFVSTGVEVDGDRFTLVGDLTLRGVTRPVSFDGEFYGVTTGPAGRPVAGAGATATINRLDFGVNFNAPLEAGGFLLGDNVQLSVEVELVLE